MGRRVVQTSVPSINISDITKLGESKDCNLVYHKDEDTLFIRPGNARPGTSIDWNGIWIRIDPENNEIIGVEIEDFEEIFLRKYPEIAKTWKDVRPMFIRKKQTKCEQQESFVLIILRFLLNLFKNKPLQERLGLAPA